MPLWITVFLRCLPLDTARPQWPRDAAFAVLEQERIAALTPAAMAAGLQGGMRRAGAAAMAPEITLLARDIAAENRVLHEAALALLQYTPEIALAEPDAILLQVGASLAYFGGPRALHRRVAATLHAMGLHASLGLAPTAQGAWLLARQAAPRAPRKALRAATLARRLDALPCALLPDAQPRLDWLHDIGCHTLGALRGLPRAGLQRRCGTELVRALDSAYGATPECHAWIQPPARFRQRLELPDYIEHADAVLASARRLLEQLCGWLAAGRRAVQHLTLVLEHERGRRARPPSELPLSLAQPAWQQSHLLDLLREKLGRLQLEAPVIALVLNVAETVEQPAASTCLFPEPGGTPAEHARLLDLLSARLGRERVLHARPVADHRPEAANGWQAAQDGAGGPDTLPGPLDRPFWLLDPPILLQVVRHRPAYAGQPLRLVRGPERIESGWWDAALTVRDYFVAEDAAAARYWIYRERDTEHARWFLHGRYA
ncbi:DNA polymerase Y family protein [Bordetella sp. BOR01]|uniref:Y-family DNA polymerase n=1 Tax=Bordetella sp. BOR01 TaxID=2854779 RepID=UPI001C43F467|nr:DNA polymerase Y family protein [Bordetella sp. BOR01]MBV7485855.1 DNA polymerase Y family protein [Bordetella sp. BOR01]